MITLIILTFSKTPNHITQDNVDFISGGSRPSDKGRPGHPDPEISGGALKKDFFRLFGPQFGLRIRGGWAPPLDPPLNMIYARIRTDQVC